MGAPEWGNAPDNGSDPVDTALKIGGGLVGLAALAALAQDGYTGWKKSRKAEKKEKEAKKRMKAFKKSAPGQLLDMFYTTWILVCVAGFGTFAIGLFSWEIALAGCVLGSVAIPTWLVGVAMGDNHWGQKGQQNGAHPNGCRCRRCEDHPEGCRCKRCE